jgi:hypothetical protein
MPGRHRGLRNKSLNINPMLARRGSGTTAKSHAGTGHVAITLPSRLVVFRVVLTAFVVHTIAGLTGKQAWI